VGKLPGVGKRAVEILHGLGIIRTADIRKVPESIMLKKFGKFGRRLMELSRGIDASRIVPQSEPKSISSEHTLEEDTDNLNILMQHVLSQAETVGRRLRRQGLKGRTVTLKLKYSDFRLTTRGRTIDGLTDSTKVIADTALEILRNEKRLLKVRLIGVSVSSFEKSIQQLPLFRTSVDQEEKQTRLDSAVDEVSEKFGKGILRRGS